VFFCGVGAFLVGYGLWSGFWPLLVWPGVSNLVVGAGYFWGSAALFGKRPDGSRAIWASVVLLPYTVVAYLVWRIQAGLSRAAAYHVVNERLIVARRLLAQEMPADVSLLLDLTCEFRDPQEIRTREGYRCLPILDGGSFSAEELARELKGLAPAAGTRLLIHCAQGHGRTGMVAAAWLVLHGYAETAEEAVEMLQSVRHRVRLRRGQWETVRAVCARLA
jgi:protein-tyrosine phosphatase